MKCDDIPYVLTSEVPIFDMPDMLISYISISDMLTFEVLIFLRSLAFKSLDFDRSYLLIQETIFGLPYIIGETIESTLHWMGFDVGFESTFYLRDDYKNLYSLTLLLCAWTNELSTTVLIILWIL